MRAIEYVKQLRRENRRQVKPGNPVVIQELSRNFFISFNPRQDKHIADGFNIGYTTTCIFDNLPNACFLHISIYAGMPKV